jgi:DNA-directed RNA polymerase subunit H (RpoH/RPB5)
MSSKTTAIYNSRQTLLEILGGLGYKINDYNSFSMNEVETMFKNDQLDMLVEHTTSETPTSYDNTKIYVKYLLTTKAIRLKASIDELIELHYDLEETLKKHDILMLIVNDEPNNTLVERLKYIYDTRGIFIVVHNIKRLQRNILKHVQVPKHTILTNTQFVELSQRLNIKSPTQLPEISRFDPIALLICMRPGQVCHIERKSPTAIVSDYYRHCL